MGYVPGQKYDLFFSYAHADDSAWIEALRRSLCQGVSERLGSRVSVWQDRQNLRLGQNWQNEIEEAIDGAAAFIARCSPNYFSSRWCSKERRTFLSHHQAEESLDAIRVGDIYRFLKIVKTQAEGNLHLRFLPALQHIQFFRQDLVDSSEIDFPPGTPDFQAKVQEAVLAIATLLRAMRRRREAIYVAAAADDMLDEWTALRNELEAQGFNVRPEALVDSTFDEEVLREEIERATVSVFLLGGKHDGFVDRQIELALELGRPVLTWVHPGKSKSADRKQAALLELIREGTVFPKGSQMLGGASIRDLIRDLLELLKPRPEAPALPATAGDRGKIYLLFDPTTRQDTQFADELEKFIRTRHLTVFRPETEVVSHSDRLLRHEQFLRECDGVLLYRDLAPAKWLEQNLPDVLLAELKLHRPPLSAKACVVTDPRPLAGLGNLQIIRRGHPFDFSQLQPFFNQVRKASMAYANS
jgi:hypothetical protein